MLRGLTPRRQVARRGMRSKARRRIFCAGHEVGGRTRIIVFISLTRAAILMRRRRKQRLTALLMTLFDNVRIAGDIGAGRK